MRALIAAVLLLGTASLSSAQLYETDFTNLDGWTTTSTGTAYTWQADATPDFHCAGPYLSAPSSLNFNDGVDFGGMGGPTTAGEARSPVIDLSKATTSTPHVRFWMSMDLERGCQWDALTLRVEPIGGAAPTLDLCLTTLIDSCEWHLLSFPLDRNWGPVQIVFAFDSIDGEYNAGSGPFLDDLEVVEDPMTIVCSPAAQHHEGGSVTLATSSLVVFGVSSGLHLEATDGPVGEFGFFFIGQGYGPEIDVFNGVHCLTQPTGRYNAQIASNQGNSTLNSLGQFDASGVLQNLSGTSSFGSGFDVPQTLPFTPAGQFIVPGDTWGFQLWYRDVDGDGLPSANFSDALLVTFD